MLCQSCLYNAHSPFLICALHPTGPQANSCPDFQGAPEPEALWEPEGASYYGDELILQPEHRLNRWQQLMLLDTHPLFTGRCPQCEMPLRQTDPPRVHWDCECGWKDDSI